MRRLLLPFLLLLSACSGADTAAAEKEVARFHERLDAGATDAIWAAGAPELRQAGPKPEFDAFMKAVGTKLGKVRSSERTGWSVNYGTGGSRIELAYETQFERGAATEQFVYRMGEPPKLIAYNINSTALVVN